MVKSMDQFLRYESELAPGSGFALWSLPHILWLLILGLIAAVALLAARRCGGSGKRVIRRTFAVCALLMQVLPAIVIMWKGMYSRYTLPLHICSLASYAVCAHALFVEKSVILSELLFFPFLPGAICALLFPDWTMYPPYSFSAQQVFSCMGRLSFTYCCVLMRASLRPLFVAGRFQSRFWYCTQESCSRSIVPLV